MDRQFIDGFSGLSRPEKLEFVSGRTSDPAGFKHKLKSFLDPDPGRQQLFDDLSENSLSNYILPYGVAPNFLVNGRNYILPMVTEESSVVAAASAAAKFWYVKGGFIAKVRSMLKSGQVYFRWSGEPGVFMDRQEEAASFLKRGTSGITRSMEARGGGIRKLWIDRPEGRPGDEYRLDASFDTVDSMGANFINSCLEEFGKGLGDFARKVTGENSGELEVIMAILSNHNPGCLVECSVSCTEQELEDAVPGMGARQFIEKFGRAVGIAQADPYRAVTHNKGIFNGIDSVVIATGNDFRAIEAGGHAWAARSGRYASLTRMEADGPGFRYILELPLAVGTVGGMTGIHPLAKASLELLGNPGAETLMEIIAAAGLASNFSALRSLISTGIQSGHMKLHLANILNHLEATEAEKMSARGYFTGRTVSHHAVEAFLEKLRSRSGND